MKSNMCALKGIEPDLEKVLDEVKKVASYNGLKRKDALQLMLLAAKGH